MLEASAIHGHLEEVTRHGNFKTATKTLVLAVSSDVKSSIELHHAEVSSY